MLEEVIVVVIVDDMAVTRGTFLSVSKDLDGLRDAGLLVLLQQGRGQSPAAGKARFLCS